MKQINEAKIIKNYQERFKRYGDTPEGVQFSKEGQLFRFEKLIEIGDLSNKKILDVGCGLGHLYEFLLSRGIQVDYTGIDIVPETIAFAKKKYSEAEFYEKNLLSQRWQKKFDYVLINAVFNNAMENSGEFLQQMVQKAFARCTIGLGFNFLSTHVSFTDDIMAYHDPSEVLNFCISKLSIKTNMYHCYERRDVAVFVYR